MKSFKIFLFEEEDFEQFLRAHFGSEPAKPESHILRSKITGGIHGDIPLYIGVDPMSPYPLTGEGERDMFRGKHPHYKFPRRIHSIIPMKFDSEGIINDKVHGKIHVVRYDGSDAYRQLRALWQQNDVLNKPAEEQLKKGKAARLLQAPDLMNHPILADNSIIHDEENISIGSKLREFHGGSEPYRAYFNDPYAYSQRHKNVPGESFRDIFAFYRKIKGRDGGDEESVPETPKPSMELQPI